jgi:hypothetical protein
MTSPFHPGPRRNPAGLSFRPVWAANPAAPDPSRLALIIGNSAYRDSPLVNPANDAKACRRPLTQAGFTVDSHLNATRGDMMAAIERFGAAAKRPDTKLVVFYYAGHGAQLDWRNYLLPVDAVVQKQDDMKQRCVDLGLLLGQLSAAKDKTFVIILDACRNNPFGTAYRPEQKGLSQFDAPVGSLLAYATSPGNVASDGEGQNGLYTEHLVRELGRRGTRVEDALKRVRLNVQAGLERRPDALGNDLAGRRRFHFQRRNQASSAKPKSKSSSKPTSPNGRGSSHRRMLDDWINYLRNFPNGRFAEIAQMRLARLLAEAEQLAAEKRNGARARNSSDWNSNARNASAPNANALRRPRSSASPPSASSSGGTPAPGTAATPGRAENPGSQAPAGARTPGARTPEDRRREARQAEEREQQEQAAHRRRANAAEQERQRRAAEEKRAGGRSPGPQASRTPRSWRRPRRNRLPPPSTIRQPTATTHRAGARR